MDQPEPITVTREVQAILIPVGVPINIPAESVVYVTQALGGTVTVNIDGNLARIAGTDLDALGMEQRRIPSRRRATTVAALMKSLFGRYYEIVMTQRSPSTSSISG